MVGISYFTFVNIDTLVKNEKLISHTNDVMLKLESIISSVKDAETAQRGYLLTRRKEFLDPYYGAYDKAMNFYDDVKRMTGDNVSQQMRLDTLKMLLDQRFKLLDDRINLLGREQENPDAVNLLLEGSRLMDRIRDIILRMEAHEKELLRYRTVNAGESSLNTYIVASVFTLLAIALLVVCYIFILKELKRRTVLEHELSENVTNLKRSNENLEQFAYVASHDLQEPLRKIRAFGDLLTSEYSGSLPERAQDYMGRMNNAAIRMQVLINDLLNFSRASRNVGEFEDVILADIITGALSDVDVSASEAGAHIIVNINDKTKIKGNRTQLNQLFVNLISNAIKFRQNDRKPEIRIDGSYLMENEKYDDFTKRDGVRYFKIEVKDNGIGFDPKYLDRIFVIFQRLHARAEYKGTGIGLALCRKIAENHKGHITAESVPGEGSNFITIFPLN
jgi:signal transduction histidine kinase